MKLKQAFLGTAVAIGLAMTGCQTQQSNIAPSPDLPPLVVPGFG